MAGGRSGRRPPLQKIMHTRKRHQDMFQDLNRKLQHTAEKDKEALGPDSKVGAQAPAFSLLPSPTLPTWPRAPSLFRLP